MAIPDLKEPDQMPNFTISNGKTFAEREGRPVHAPGTV